MSKSSKTACLQVRIVCLWWICQLRMAPLSSSGSVPCPNPRLRDVFLQISPPRPAIDRVVGPWPQINQSHHSIFYHCNWYKDPPQTGPKARGASLSDDRAEGGSLRVMVGHVIHAWQKPTNGMKTIHGMADCVSKKWPECYFSSHMLFQNLATPLQEEWGL